MHVEDKRPRAPVQGMDREETISGKKGREEERSGKKEAKKQDTRQSEAGVYYSARSVPDFYCHSHDLTSSCIKATLLPAYHRFASVQPEGKLLSPSLGEGLI